LDQKPRSDGPSRFSFQKLTAKETAARAKESVVRMQNLDLIALDSEDETSRLE